MNKKCKNCGKEIINGMRDIINKYNIPFYCSECYTIDFKYQALRNLVFVWPTNPPEIVGGIIIPENIRYAWRDAYGIVLSVGKGCYTQKGKFISNNLKVGDIVIYDTDVPWKIIVDGYEVKYMGIKDIKGKVLND